MFHFKHINLKEKGLVKFEIDMDGHCDWLNVEDVKDRRLLVNLSGNEEENGVWNFKSFSKIYHGDRDLEEVILVVTRDSKELTMKYSYKPKNYFTSRPE